MKSTKVSRILKFKRINKNRGEFVDCRNRNILCGRVGLRMGLTRTGKWNVTISDTKPPNGKFVRLKPNWDFGLDTLQIGKGTINHTPWFTTQDILEKHYYLSNFGPLPSILYLSFKRVRSA